MNRVYLDYNATTPLDPSVLEVIHSTLKDCWGNPASCHDSGRKAALAIQQAREEVAKMIGADTQNVIFMSGGTEANNTVIHTAQRYFHSQTQGKNHTVHHPFGVDKEGKPHVITTEIEHDSIRLPLERLNEEGLLDVTFLPVSKSTGCVEVDDILSAIRPTTCLVTIMLANNETGSIQPVEKIFRAIRDVNKQRHGLCNILTHTDAAQAIGKIPVHLQDLGVDYLTIVGHKFYGPRIGALYIRSPTSETPVYPLMYGGGQEMNLRPGTENVGMIAGLGKAAQLISDNLDRYTTHMRDVRDYLESQLQVEFGDKIHFNNHFPNVLPNTCNVSFLGSGLEGYKILGACRHLEASTGAACHSTRKTSAVLLASGVDASMATSALRLSVGRDTTKNDVEMVVQDLSQAVQALTSRHKLGLKPEKEQTKALDYSVDKN